MIPDAAVKAGAAAIQSPATPEIWRSWEALAEAVLTAAAPHLTSLVDVQTGPDLFGGQS